MSWPPKRLPWTFFTAGSLFFTVRSALSCSHDLRVWAEHQFALANTLHPQKKLRMATWHPQIQLNQLPLAVEVIKIKHHVQATMTLYWWVFYTTVGVYQGSLLLPVLLNIYLGDTMQETLCDHHTSISFSGRPICNLCFVNDINLITGTTRKLQNPTKILKNSLNTHGMEISIDKSKVMVIVNTYSRFLHDQSMA